MRAFSRLVHHLRWCLVIGGAVFALPLSGFSGFPLASLTGGMFAELSAVDVYWNTLAFFAAAWSTTVVAALLLDETSRGPSGAPAVARSILAIPLPPRGIIVLAALAAPAFIAMIALALDPLAATGMALLAFLTANLLVILVTAPIVLAYPGFRPLPGPLKNRAWAIIGRWSTGRRLAEGLHDRISALVRRGAPSLMRPNERGGTGLPPEHYMALICATGYAVLAFFVYLLLDGAPELALAPAGALLSILLTTGVWLIGIVQRRMTEIGFSPEIALLLLIFGGYQISGSDHYFGSRPDDKALTPSLHANADPTDPATNAIPGRAPLLDGVRNRKSRDLVVITTTGGGIQAAGWTTLALERLQREIPGFLDDVALVSGVSGGSVGTAFHADAAVRHGGQPAADAQVHERSMRSSLAAAAFGMAYLELPRILRGGIWSGTRDRGTLLENQWCYASRGDANAGDGPALSAFAPLIAAGKMPAFILNCTAMETGRRVMITPLAFPNRPEDGAVGDTEYWDRQMPDDAGRSARPAPRAADGSRLWPRAQTMDEYLLGPKPKARVSMSLWSAARLSATFPYVSPAARSELEDPGSGQGNRRTPAHHMIDGGYYDNYGVASALDWLQVVLEDRARHPDRYAFERVLVVQIRAFGKDPTFETPPVSGAASATLGPIFGVLNIRDGGAFTRNWIEFDRFVESWNRRFDLRADERAEEGKARDVVHLSSVVLSPKPDQNGPLSWHLKPSDKRRMAAWWEKDPEIRNTVQAMKTWLAR